MSQFRYKGYFELKCYSLVTKDISNWNVTVWLQRIFRIEMLQLVYKGYLNWNITVRLQRIFRIELLQLGYKGYFELKCHSLVTKDISIPDFNIWTFYKNVSKIENSFLLFIRNWTKISFTYSVCPTIPAAAHKHSPKHFVVVTRFYLLYDLILYFINFFSSSPSGKIPTLEQGIEPETSWLVVRDSDH